jgi:2-oxoisovalerate dehydrogenase E1 component alpha subunit
MELHPSAVQLLDENGVFTDHANYPLALGHKEIRDLYKTMALVRSLDTEAVRLQRQGKMNLWCPVASQEAAQVGSAAALRVHDRAFPQGREFGVGVTLGLAPHDLLRVWKGEVLGGGWDPRESVLALYTFPIGSQAPHATGYAMGMVRDKVDGAALCYVGDGAFGSGDVHESLNWSAVFNLPVVFFCQNNQYAISVPFSRQSATPIFQRGSGFGVRSVQIDGNDLLACHAVVKAELERAQAGEGPALIEALTYRVGPHTTSDDASRYREAAEEDLWRGRDPIDRVRTYLLSSEIADQAWLDEVEADIREQTTAFRGECLSVTPPEPGELFDHTYAEMPSNLAAEVRSIAEFDLEATDWNRP